MGLADFFRRRRERESAIQSREITADPSRQAASLGSAAGDPQAQAAAGGMDLAQLGQVGQMIAQAAQQGNIQVHVGQPQEVNVEGGADLGEQIKEIMRRHGLDPDNASGDIDASALPAMQQEILEALGQSGFALGGTNEMLGGQLPGIGGSPPVPRYEGDSPDFDPETGRFSDAEGK